MHVDTLGIALSGLASAAVRLDVAAHHVANLSTEDVRPQQATQRERSFGGSATRVDQAATSRPVDHLDAVVDQLRATYQYTASLRVLAVESDLRGQMTDFLA